MSEVEKNTLSPSMRDPNALDSLQLAFCRVKDRIGFLENELYECTAANKAFAQANQNLIKVNDMQTADIGRVNKVLSDRELQIRDSEIAKDSLGKDKTKLMEDKSLLAAQVAQSEKKEQELWHALENAKAAVNEMSRVKAEHAASCTEVQRLQSDLANARFELASSREERMRNVDDLENQLESAHADAEQLRSKVSFLKRSHATEVLQLRAHVIDLTIDLCYAEDEQYKIAQAYYTTHSSCYSPSKILKLRQELEITTKLQQASERVTESLRHQHDALRKELEAEKQNKAAKKLILENLSAVKTALEQELRDIRKRLEDEEGEVKSLRNRSHKLEQDLVVAEKNKFAAKIRAQKLEWDVKEVSNNLDKAKHTASDQQDQITKLITQAGTRVMDSTKLKRERDNALSERDRLRFRTRKRFIGTNELLELVHKGVIAAEEETRQAAYTILSRHNDVVIMVAGRVLPHGIGKPAQHAICDDNAENKLEKVYETKTGVQEAELLRSVPWTLTQHGCRPNDNTQPQIGRDTSPAVPPTPISPQRAVCADSEKSSTQSPLALSTPNGPTQKPAVDGRKASRRTVETRSELESPPQDYSASSTGVKRQNDYPIDPCLHAPKYPRVRHNSYSRWCGDSWRPC